MRLNKIRMLSLRETDKGCIAKVEQEYISEFIWLKKLLGWPVCKDIQINTYIGNKNGMYWHDVNTGQPPKEEVWRTVERQSKRILTERKYKRMQESCDEKPNCHVS